MLAPRRGSGAWEVRTVNRSLCLLVLVALATLLPGIAGAEAPAGQMTLVYNISIVPRWFDPAESEGLVTPFIFYYALHDALVKPMLGNPVAPCLAESWSASADGLTYSRPSDRHRSRAAWSRSRLFLVDRDQVELRRSL